MSEFPSLTPARVHTLTDGVLPLLARWLISIIFVTSVLSKIFSWSENIEYMRSKGLPAVSILLAGALLIEGAGSLCLIAGLFARQAALIMFLYLIPVTGFLHAFMSVNSQKNLGIMGGLLMIAAHGPGRFALGQRRHPTY
jgi:putative oxidoreductase